MSTRYSDAVRTGREGAAAPSHRARPGLLLATWIVLLALFAALAPIGQAALRIPFELISFVMLAPAFASLVVVVRPSWMPPWWSPVRALRVAATTAAACVAVIVFIATLAALTDRVPSWDVPGIASPLWAFLPLQALGVLSEELGWRGVVQRAGERLAPPIVVATIAGFLFGATHLGYWSLGPIPLLTFAVTATLMSLAIFTLFDGSVWQRMLPAVVIHLGVNLGIASLAAPDEPLATTLPTLVAAMAMLAVAVMVRVLAAWRRGMSARAMDRSPRAPSSPA